jgi:N-carbamoylputrescine amidase
MNVTVAVTQTACDWDSEGNVARAEALVREAAARGAQVVLLQELFATPYFCKDKLAEHFQLAHCVDGHPLLARMQALAAELKVVLPISFFERSNQSFFNSLAMIDADGTQLGIYRKAHIPDDPGYQEKFYFSPGDTGFQVWTTAYGRLGAAICWDQWFPEAARIMVLKGADMLLYPTAIGSEPENPALNSREHWQRTMQGHAAANMVPVAAANRIGTEQGRSFGMTFYGSSFIADQTGAIIAELDQISSGCSLASFDLEAVRAQRWAWGLFRDRRPDQYGALLSFDGCG